MLKIAYLTLVILIYALVQRALSKLIRRMGAAKQVNSGRTQYVDKTVQILLVLVTLAVIGLILGINYGELSFFVSSAFAVLGVALFAQWSILSNITASVIIFFGFPYRIGDRVRVIEPGDERCEGVIREISLFHVIIRRDNGDEVTYPNSLLLQKPVVKINTQATGCEGDADKPGTPG